MKLSQTEERLYKAMLKLQAINNEISNLESKVAKLRQSKGDALYEINQVVSKNPDILIGVQTMRGTEGD